MEYLVLKFKNITQKIADFWEQMLTFRKQRNWLSDNVIFWNIIISVSLIIILVLTILFKIKPGTDELVLHYNILVEIDVVDKGWYVYQLPILAFVFLIYNTILSKKFYIFEPFASYLLIITSSIVSAILLTAGIALSYL